MVVAAVVVMVALVHGGRMVMVVALVHGGGMVMVMVMVVVALVHGARLLEFGPIAEVVEQERGVEL